MAYDQTPRYITLNAPSTALSTYQYHMVKASSSAGVFVAGTTKITGKLNCAIGVLQQGPTVSGEPCQLAALGSVTKLVCGSTKLVPGSFFLQGPAGVAVSTSAVVTKDIIYGPWLSAGATTGTIGTAVFQVVGITT